MIIHNFSIFLIVIENVYFLTNKVLIQKHLEFVLQGREKDVVILSCVRAKNNRASIG